MVDVWWMYSVCDWMCGGCVSRCTVDLNECVNRYRADV